MNRLDENTSVITQNSLGMEFRVIPKGSYIMGQHDGDPDEHPVHVVFVSKDFALSTVPVTNAQYEKFCPRHRTFRGIHGRLSGDSEAVTYVSYEDACAFCRWLSLNEGKSYRLPTEAEWEYACRAGTTTDFSTGNTLPEEMQRAQKNQWLPEPISLEVGTTAPNAYGLYDMHGLVEEWCYDWYGPYSAGEAVDPVGYEDGDTRVTRGGSHSTDVHYLRSASRMAAIPQDRSSTIGFRVAMGELPVTPGLQRLAVPRYAYNVRRQYHVWEPEDQPMFSGPIPYILKPNDGTPFYKHNHCPSITWCDNGDLFAIWFSCDTEAGREMTILASRLRADKHEWDRASEFFDVADRNTTGSSLFRDRAGNLIHINGVGVGYGWGNLALVMRSSYDNGITWSKPTVINPQHGLRNQPISGAVATKDGWLLQVCDAVAGDEGGSALHISYDEGRTWIDYGWGMPNPVFEEGNKGGWIAGIHAGIVALDDGRLIALGRGNDINGRMPLSVSTDGGRSWKYYASPFPPLSGGQRLILTKLIEGPVLLISFTDRSEAYRKCGSKPVGMEFVNSRGKDFLGNGMFAALSWDGGASWPVKRLLTPEEGSQQVDGGGWTGVFTMDRYNSEPMGYLAATQTPDGTIHLISSKQYYRFNIAWIMQTTQK